MMKNKPKKRNKKFNIKKSNIHDNYASLRLVENEALFLQSLRQAINNPFLKQNFLPYKKRFSENLVDRRMYMRGENERNDLLWICEVISALSPQLKEYVKSREIVDELILSGDYTEALNEVNKVGELFGFSYWYLENKFSLLSRLDREEDIYLYARNIKKSFSEYEERETTLLLEKSLKSKSTSRFEFMIQSILDSVEEDSIDYDSISYIFKFDINKKYNFSYIFKFILHLNVIDIYNSIIRAASYSTIHNLEFKNTILNYLENSNNIISDPKISNILLYNSQEFNIDDDYFRICELYISGKFEDVVDRFEKISKPLKQKIIFIELYVKSLIHLKKPLSLRNNGVFGELLTFAYNITSDNDERHLSLLNRITCQFTQNDYYYSIVILKSKISTNTKPEIDNIYRFIDSLVNQNNPFRNDIFIENSICSSFNKKEIEKFQNKIPSFRLSKWKGDELFSNGNYNNALILYDSIKNVPEYLQLEVLEKKIITYYELNAVNEVVDLIVDLYLTKKIILKRLPLYQIKEKVLNSAKLNRVSINTPIFSHIMKEASLCTDQKVALLCDDYLFLNNFRTAEEITEINDKTIFLFTSVMTIEVINRQDEKDTNLDDFINRALLLMKVKEKSDDSLSLFYDIEYLISQYSRKLCKNNLGRGKININLDAIKRIAKSNLSFEFNELLNELGSVNLDSDIEFTNSYIKTQEMTLKIRDLYATHEVYGLENTLNTDIRHNGIVPTIRAVFEANGVICQKKNDIYLNNLKYEEYCKNNLINNAYMFFQEKIMEFSEEIDNLTNNLKNKYLHIFTNDLDDKHKLFKLIISKDEVTDILSYIVKNQDFDEVTSFILEMLNSKTKKAMKEGSEILRIGFKAEVERKISQLIKFLNKEEKINKQFIENLKHTKNQLEHVISEVADWLNFINKSADDFSLMIPITEALEFVEKTHPNIEIEIEYINTEALNDYHYNGDYLVTFIRMFLILFQNAAKSIKHENECRIKLTYVLNKSNATVTVENNYNTIDKQLILSIKESLEKGKELEGASKGSGSGIFKVKKMLSHELNAHHFLDISFDDKARTFKVIINYDINSINKGDRNELSNY